MKQLRLAECPRRTARGSLIARAAPVLEVHQIGLVSPSAGVGKGGADVLILSSRPRNTPRN